MPKKQLTNEAFVGQLMKSSNHGALMQVFVLEALRRYSADCARADPSKLDTMLFAGTAWVGCAKELQDRLDQHLGPTPPRKAEATPEQATGPTDPAGYLLATGEFLAAFGYRFERCSESVWQVQRSGLPGMPDKAVSTMAPSLGVAVEDALIDLHGWIGKVVSAADTVVNRWERGDLAGAVNDLDAAIQEGPARITERIF